MAAITIRTTNEEGVKVINKFRELCENADNWKVLKMLMDNHTESSVIVSDVTDKTGIKGTSFERAKLAIENLLSYNKTAVQKIAITASFIEKYAGVNRTNVNDAIQLFSKTIEKQKKELSIKNNLWMRDESLKRVKVKDVNGKDRKGEFVKIAYDAVNGQ